MKKKTITVFLTALVAMNTMAGCASTTPKEKEEKTEISKEEKSETDAETVKVTSVFGEDEVELEYPEVPERVVSMAGFATEMLLALGLEDHIVGYAWQDNEVLPQYQEAFEKLEPLCPPAMDPGEEKVLAAEPDLVLSWASWSDEEYFNYKNLAKNGINAYGFHSERWSGGHLEDVYTDFLNIGKIFRCDASSNEESCMTVGGGLPQELLEKAGGENVVTDVEANWKRGYSWEKIIAADPEWIVIDYYASADEADAVLNLLKSDPQLNQMQAVLKDQIVLVGLTDISCSERIDETVALLASEFHGVE